MTAVTLPHDVARCAGRRDLTPDTDICPVRASCLRWTTFNAGDFGRHTPVWMWICSTPVHEQMQRAAPGCAPAPGCGVTNEVCGPDIANHPSRAAVGVDDPALFMPDKQGPSKGHA